MKPVLHNYFRSSSSYRVRIALGLKGLDYDYVAIHLNRNGGEQFSDDFRRLNPHALVPVYDDGDTQISQSLAILEYLDEIHPTLPLLPADPRERAYVRSLALAVACEIHPLNNLRVLKFLTGELQLTEEAKSRWIHHWIQLGLEALENQISTSPLRGQFCYGDHPTIADCCLIPQLFNATRFQVDLEPYPTLRAIDAACATLEAFQRAHPAKQPDAE